jgi:energy-converting hydrogenase Eha subunit G
VVLVTVEEPSFFAKNGLFLGGGLGGAVAAAGVVVYLKKYRH